VSDFYVRLALTLRMPLSELMTWEPEALQTALVWVDERNEAAKDAAKGR
jgi:hypothetical protein